MNRSYSASNRFPTIIALVILLLVMMLIALAPLALSAPGPRLAPGTCGHCGVAIIVKSTPEPLTLANPGGFILSGVAFL